MCCSQLTRRFEKIRISELPEIYRFCVVIVGLIAVFFFYNLFPDVLRLAVEYSLVAAFPDHCSYIFLFCDLKRVCMLLIRVI